MKGIENDPLVMRATFNAERECRHAAQQQGLTEGFVLFLVVLLGGSGFVGLLSLIWPNAIEGILLVMFLAMGAWMHKAIK